MVKVEIKVDMQNRDKLRRLHTATHIMNYASKKVLGNHVWQNGSNLKADVGTLDITHYDNLSLDEIFKIERLANQIILDNKEVFIEEIERSKAEEKYGFTIYQGGAIPMKKLRIVRIQDSDIEACGGIHMGSTGGIGLIKLVDAQKIQDGVVRLKYVVLDYAYDLIEDIQRREKDLCDIFSVSSSQLIKTGEKFFNEWKDRGKEIEKLKKRLVDAYTNMILDMDKSEFEFENLDMNLGMEIFSRVINDKQSLKIISDKFIFATSDFEIKDFKKEINKGTYSVYIK